MDVWVGVGHLFILRSSVCIFLPFIVVSVGELVPKGLFSKSLISRGDRCVRARVCVFNFSKLGHSSLTALFSSSGLANFRLNAQSAKKGAVVENRFVNSVEIRKQNLKKKKTF